MANAGSTPRKPQSATGAVPPNPMIMHPQNPMSPSRGLSQAQRQQAQQQHYNATVCSKKKQIVFAIF